MRKILELTLPSLGYRLYQHLGDPCFADGAIGLDGVVGAGVMPAGGREPVPLQVLRSEKVISASKMGGPLRGLRDGTRWR